MGVLECGDYFLLGQINRSMPNFSYRKFVLAFLAIVLVAGGGYFVWKTFFKYDIAEVYKKAEADYIAEMTADTYGGKTPQETLDLFVAALRAGDVELASKYFLIRSDAPREEWVKYLTQIKERGLLTKMAEDIARDAKPFGNPPENEFYFGLFNDDGSVAIPIDMRLNKYSRIWKIESF
jgi:hypothetical protein